MDAYALHLAMAALAGASVVAISAYFMHRKTLAQLLDFARSVEREREKSNGFVEEDGAADRDGGYYYKKRSHGHRRRAAVYGRGSASLPDVTVAGRDGLEEEERRRRKMVNGTGVTEEEHRGMGVPPGLPRLHTLPEGTFEHALVMSDFSPT